MIGVLGRRSGGPRPCALPAGVYDGIPRSGPSAEALVQEAFIRLRLLRSTLSPGTRACVRPCWRMHHVDMACVARVALALGARHKHEDSIMSAPGGRRRGWRAGRHGRHGRHVRHVSMRTRWRYGGSNCQRPGNVGAFRGKRVMDRI